MIDPELKTQLDQINQNLADIKKKSGTSLWKSFLSGVLSALGYVVGLAIVIVILGWILQKTGLLPAFEREVKNFSDIINEAKKFTTPSNEEGQNPPNNNGGGGSTITLPNGQQYHVDISQ